MKKTLGKLKDFFNSLFEDYSLTAEEIDVLSNSDDYTYHGVDYFASHPGICVVMHIYTDKEGKELTQVEAKEAAQRLLAEQKKSENSPDFPKNTP